VTNIVEIPGPINEAIKNRFWSHIMTTDSDEDCWLWVGSQNPAGYGRIWVNGKLIMAHRLSFLIANTVIPNDHVIRHRCDNPACCNPHHLISGTQGDNNRDKAERGRAPRGSEHHRAKITEEWVKVIRLDERDNGIIGAEHGIDRSVVCKIKNRKIWSHVI
jgi:hypothetical protein